ncbi:MAG: type I restriction endonuclease subunit R, partial [Nitrososphaeria archaeon]|nr:type I restriction endonuclease subunit R [Nitrososphaeria archaeon]
MVELTEDYLVERPAINWLKELGYFYIHGAELSPENGERESYRKVILKKRFIDAVRRLNPWLTQTQLEEVYRKVTEIDHPDFVMKSKLFYDMLTNGVKITTKEKGEERTKVVKLVDFENPNNNEFLVANQFTVDYLYQKDMQRRPDAVIFINGLPLVVFEFKSFNANEVAKDAFYDHKAKMGDIPQLYVYAHVLVVSDGLETKHGSKTNDWDRFFVWEGIFDDEDLEVKETADGHYQYIFKPTGEKMTSLEVLLKGLFRKEHLMEYLQDFVFYEKSGESYDVKIAMFHQFYTVRKAVEQTKRAVLEGKTPEERRVGVVWHTQGTGKSLEMLFYARKVLKVKELENPILLFITDRNNLDDQLYGVFSELPIAKQANTIKELQQAIKTTAGGIIFATIQKFGKKKAEEYPFLTDRRNIIVVADEAHRSQYKELAMNLRRAIPNAAFMGFTATPIELEDRSTTLVFGDHISVYSMDKARRHGVVVPIYYEARLPELHLTNEFIDEDFEKLSESVAKDPSIKAALKKKYARLEELILAKDRLEKVAKDIVDHFNKRVQELKGKAIVVAISRKVAVKLYEEIKKLPNAPSLVVVMSGNKQKDPKEYWPHIRNKHELEELADKFKNPETDPQMAIVVEMWLTGFDAPCLHTMYFDQPMKGHSLVQAIARVNRVFKDKPGGLIVDYIGIADNLKKSLAIYTFGTIKGTLLNVDEVIAQLKEKYDLVTSLFYGINYKRWKTLAPEQLSRLTTMTYDKISGDEELKKKFVRNFVALKKLYALASPRPEAYEIKDDIRFFEMIKKMIVKYSTARIREISRELEYEISHLISKSITAEEPLDVFALIGKEKPDISIFDEKFLAKFKNMEYKNYAAELLAKIIKDQLVVRMNINPFRYRSLYEILKKIIDEYNIKLLNTAEIIDELINIANEMKKKVESGKKLKLTEMELAFYDLLVSKEKFFENYEQIQEVA